MYCKYCGKEIDEDSIYCKHCGKQVKSLEQSSQMKEIENEDKLQLIEEKTFSTEVTDEELASAIEDKYGVLYSKNGKKLIKCKNENLFEYSVCHGVTTICDKAFSNCTKLRFINIPIELSSIGRMAFYRCENLTTIALPIDFLKNKVKVFCDNIPIRHYIRDWTLNTSGVVRDLFVYSAKIDSYNFVVPGYINVIWKKKEPNCNWESMEYVNLPHSLTSVYLPRSLRTIGDMAFEGCHNIDSIELPSALARLGNHAFYDCKALTAIIIPKSVPSIGIEIFANCNSIEKVITYSNKDDKRHIGETVKKHIPKRLQDKIEIVDSSCLSTEVTEEDIANAVVDEYGVLYSKDGKRLLKNTNKKIKEYAVKEGTIVICDGAFWVGEDPNDTTYESEKKQIFCGMSYGDPSTPVFVEEFIGNSGKIILPNSLKIIGSRAFWGCKNLTNIILPNNLEFVGDRAFEGCWSIHSIHLPASLVKIGFKPFHNSINVTSNSYCIKVENNLLIQGTHVISTIKDNESIIVPEYITTIRNYAFANCSNLSVIQLPFGLKHIDDYAFKGCSAMSFIDLPDTLQTIGSLAFQGCTCLKSINLPNSLNSIGDSAFADCTKLETINLPTSLVSIGILVFSGCDSLQTIVTTKTNGKASDNRGTISNELSSLKVDNGLLIRDDNVITTIGNPSEIVVPNYIKSIGDYAFAYLTTLSSIILPDGMERIGERAFWECENLLSINFPKGLKFIGHEAFDGSNLAESDVFETIEKLTSPADIFVNDVDFIDAIEDTYGVLYSDDGMKLLESKNEKLSQYVVKEGTKIICNSAFSYNSKLESIFLPNSLTHIGNKAFEGCKGLKKIFIPSSLEYVGNRLFYGCDELEQIEVNCLLGTKEKDVIVKFKKLLPYSYDIITFVKNESIHSTTNNTRDNIQQGKYLFFDTETIGLPLNYRAPSRDTNNWPRMVQLSWILSDSEKNILSKGNYIIKPDGFTIPSEASRLHGITTERAMNEGKPISDVLEKFLNDLDMCDIIVCHNANFDTKIVGAELIRLGKEDIVRNKKSICTMEGTIDYCELPGLYGYKFPKLQELHYKLFGSNFDDAHNSQADVEATFNCFWELRKREIL